MTCKELAQSVLEDIKVRVAEMKRCGYAPSLAIVSVGNDPASASYVKGKIKDCMEVGIIARHIQLPEDITQEDLGREISEARRYATGIILQLPIPKHLDANKAIENIRPDEDVDGLRPDSEFTPCTARGVYEWLKQATDLEGKDVLIINRSKLVGRPLAKLLLDANATVTVAHSYTDDRKLMYEYVPYSDIVITATGNPEYLWQGRCKSNAIIVDVGIMRVENKLVGDVSTVGNTQNRIITPVPGGVGLLTRAYLLKNLIEAAEKQHSF